jgi:hypothetical protein
MLAEPVAIGEGEAEVAFDRAYVEEKWLRAIAAVLAHQLVVFPAVSIAIRAISSQPIRSLASA